MANVCYNAGHMKKRFSSFLARWYVIAGLVILAIIVLFAIFGGNGKPPFDTAKAELGDVIEKVSVSGKVSAIDKADLAFEKGGVISGIGVKVGDRVARGQVIATLGLASDMAQLRSAEANLEERTRTLRPEEQRVEQSKVDSARAALISEERDAFDASRSAYVQVESALINNLDQFFRYPRSVNPEINIRTRSENEKRAVNFLRFEITEQMEQWKEDMENSSSTANRLGLLERTESRLNLIKSFVSTMSEIINDLDITNSGLSQTTIDSYVVLGNTAMSGVNGSIETVSEARAQLTSRATSFEEATNSYELRTSGASAQTINAERARVDQFRAEVEKNYLKAPFDGVVTRIEPSIGEFVAGGSPVFTVVSDGQFKIETNITEADIAKVSINNIATITLDAYGQEVPFEAKVTFIDPAETVIDGVSTYKVTLNFLNSDTRIRSGMTANVDIETRDRQNVVRIPLRAIVDEKGTKKVRVVSSNGKEWTLVPVTTGLRGSDGTIEVISGLNVGDTVVTNINK